MILPRFGHGTSSELMAQIMRKLSQGTATVSSDENSFQSHQGASEIQAQVLQLLKKHLHSNRSELPEGFLKKSFILDSYRPTSFHFLQRYILFPQKSALDRYYQKTIE
jgi:hypothetical protein